MLHVLLKSANSVIVFNCQMGRGRTTAGMVCAHIIWHKVHDATDANGKAGPCRCPKDPENPNRNDAEYPVVIEITEALPNGARAKRLLDTAIDECDTIQNLRTAIAQCDSYGKGLDAPPTIDANRGSAFWISRGSSYLRRYCTLLMFAAFVDSAGSLDNLSPDAFSKWCYGKSKVTELIETARIQ